jgi:hypothetical protein
MVWQLFIIFDRFSIILGFFPLCKLTELYFAILPESIFFLLSRNLKVERNKENNLPIKDVIFLGDW